MKTHKLLVASLAIAIGAAVASIVIVNRKPERPVALEQASQPATIPAPKISESTTPAEIPVVESKPHIEPAPTNVQPAANPQKVVTQTAPPANANGPLQDPTARAALSLVGADPDAEQYWAEAIFDPSLPDQEREDLMEDLNEDGLSDPQHPGPQDLPLIVNRIRIIEEIAPYADDFMLEHLGEADKDLRNMLAGQPVQ
ncbi:MAG TPA: hypothetical protein VF480_07840 [Verrucomicrobiae bacterium]|jgi:hypothetical protein